MLKEILLKLLLFLIYLKNGFKFKLFFLLFFLLVLIGCSPGMFFDNPVDQEVLNSVHYRKYNSECSGMPFSSSVLSVLDFRNLVNCFSGGKQGGEKPSPPFQRLIDSLSDADLSTLVDVFNDLILNDKTKLYRIEQTFNALKQKKIGNESFLESSIKNFGKIIGNINLVASVLEILKQGRVPGKLPDQKVPDPTLLKAIEIISAKFSNDVLMEFIDFGLNIAGAPAFESLQARFKDGYPQGEHLKQITDGLYTYLHESHQYECEPGNWVDLKHEFFQAIVDGGHLFQFFGKILGTDISGGVFSQEQISQNIKTKVAHLASIFQTVFKTPTTGQALIEKLAQAFRDFNGPIECLYGAKTIPNAAMHLFREISQPENLKNPDKYILFYNRLNMIQLSAFCKMPKSLEKHYQTLTETVEAGIMPDLAELIQRLYQEKGLKWKGCGGNSPPAEEYPLLAHLLINFLGDTGRNEGRLPTGGFSNLLPLLFEMTNRDAWVDLFLVMALSNDKDQLKMREVIKFITEPQVHLDQDNIFNVITRVASKTTRVQLFNFIRSLTQFLKINEPILIPVLTQIRESFYVNDAHPFIDFIREIMSHASQYTNFYNTLFLVSDRPEFKETVYLLSEMAQDGRLQRLLEDLVPIFHKFADQGKLPVQLKEAPLLEMSRRHELKGLSNGEIETPYTVKNLNLIPVIPGISWYSQACRDLSPMFSLIDSSSDRYEAQFELYWACIGGHPNSSNPDQDEFYQFAKEFLYFFSHQKMQSVRSEENVTGLEKIKELTQRLFLPNFDQKNFSEKQSALQQLQFIIDSGIQAYDEGHEGHFFSLMHSIPFWIQGPSAGGLDGKKSVLKPLLDAAGRIMTTCTKEVQVLERSLGEFLAGSSATKFFRAIYSLAQSRQEEFTQSSSSRTESPFDALMSASFRGTIGKWVEYKECEDREHQINLRVQEIIDEARTNVSTWDLVSLDSQAGRKVTRKSWSQTEIYDFLEWMLNQFTTSEKQKGVSWKLLDAYLHFFQYFSLPEEGGPDQPRTLSAHYRVSDLLDWLYERSLDYRLILYFYPGEDRPRVRLVNTLDLLELVLINTDDSNPLLNWGKNMGLAFVQEYAEAWGDLPRNLWPPEIQEKFPQNGDSPKTLLEATQGILNRSTSLENLEILTYRIFGTPQLPSCYRNLEGESSPVQAPFKSKTAFFSALLAAQAVGLDFVDTQRKIFNLWQVNSVLIENSTGSGKGKFKPMFPPKDPEKVILGGGLEIMRDLFFQILYSTPEKDRDPSKGDHNYLSLILRAARMGTLSQLGKQLQRIKRPNPQDFDDSAWKALNDLSSILVQATQSDQARSTVDHLVKLSKTVVQTRFVRDQFDIFTKRFSELQGFSEYQDLHLEEALDPILRFFAQLPQIDSSRVSDLERETSQNLLFHLGSLFKRNDLSPFLILAGDQRKDSLENRTHAEKFYQGLETLSQLIGRGEKSLLKDFLKNIVRPSLSEQPHTRYTDSHVNTRRSILNRRN